MSGTVNMFAAKKVKLHSMQSSKWTTKDKITQYKGLINLYTRDRKIMEVDTNVNRKKLQRELAALQKSVETDRMRLDNAIRGDKQQLRNTLSEHRELQLAYQNSQPHKVIECIHQLNFAKRKVLDKLLYQTTLKSKKLIDLKQEQALLEDRLKYAFLGQIRQEKDAQIITGKVQDAILKKEAAMAIKQIYNEIIGIMKKDALYFDAIITTIENDGFSQSKCFLGATTLGQLATEYLDDRRSEYYTLEKIIIQDMDIRKKDIKLLQEKLRNAQNGIKELLRKDSDVNTCNVHLPDTHSMETIRANVAEIEKTLKFLQNATLADSYESIFPCLNEQLKQKKRLKILSKKCERDRDILLNKLNHAELMANTLQNTMVETTSDYKKRKGELLDEIENYKKKRKLNWDKIQHKHNLVANVRLALRQLLQISKGIQMEPEKKKPVQTGFFRAIETPPVATQGPKEPEKDETEALKILPLLCQRFTFLMSSYREQDPEHKVDEAYVMFENLMLNKMVETSEFSDKKISESSLLEGLYQETSHQLTREDIKKQSDEIVAANTKNEDLVPLFVMPKKKKFGKFKK